MKEYQTQADMWLDVPKGGIGAEIGVCQGRSAMSLYHITKPRMLHLCDAWEPDLTGVNKLGHDDTALWFDDHEQLVRKFFEKEIEQEKVVINKEYGGNFLYQLPNDFLDWIFLDADHNYEPVKIELELSLQKVKVGGLIMCHDFVTQPRVWRAGTIRAFLEKMNLGVITAEGITIERFPTIMTRRVV